MALVAGMSPAKRTAKARPEQLWRTMHRAWHIGPGMLLAASLIANSETL
jgi:hypothetical protein